MLSGDLRDGRRSAWLEIENGTYQYEADAVRRVLTLAELHLRPCGPCTSSFRPTG